MRRRFPTGIIFVGLLLTLVSLVPAPAAPCPPPGQTAGGTPLTNEDVLKMVEAQLGDAVIVTKIRSSPSAFDTSTDALIKLKQAGVSDAIMQAIAEAGSLASMPAKAAELAVASAASMGPVNEIGVYYKQGDTWREIQPEVVNWKTGGVLRA